MISIFIAGGDILSTALISSLRDEAYSSIVGLYETDPDAPGTALARELSIPVFDSLEAISTVRPAVVINLSGNAKVTQDVRARHEGIEVIESEGARLILEAAERIKRLRFDRRKSIDDQRSLFDFVIALEGVQGRKRALDLLLDYAMKMSGCPGAFLAKADETHAEILAHRGLSKRFLGDAAHRFPAELLSGKFLGGREPVENKDVLKYRRGGHDVFVAERLRSYALMPMAFPEGETAFVFLGDYKPRAFRSRLRDSLSLLVSIAELVLNWLDSPGRTPRVDSSLGNAREDSGGAGDERTRQLRRLNEELEHANQMKSRIIANMSHELRTPLNSIIGFSSVLLERAFGDLTENQQRYIENINSSGNYLLELINNMLDIAKIESGKFELAREAFKVADLVQGVTATMQPLIDAKLGEFSVEIADEVGELTADPVKLKQILYNLISNAVKFTAQGGRAGIKVKRTAVDGAPYMQFAIWDNGIGIAPEDKERIFLEFEQADSSFSKKYGGAGLGLSLTKKLVEIQAGEIWVDSRLGVGSTFSFTLPCVTESIEPIPRLAEEAAALDFPWMSEDAPMILVVEDDVPTAELLTIHLTQAGYRVSHAYNGYDAVEKARRLSPFAVTLDVMIPGRDGWEVLQDLKSSPETANIPVIIHSVIDNRDLAFALGATDYLMKPLDKNALLSKLEEISTGRGRSVTQTTILLVEPDPEEVARLREVIGDDQIVYHTAETGKKGIELAFALRPTLIILDFDLPDMQIFDFVRALKDAHSTRDIPIFLLSQKDLSVKDRMMLVGKIERIMRKQAFDTQGLIDHIRELEISFPRKAGLIDEHTGLLNHRYFHLRLAQETERSTRYKLPLILVIVDVDDFGHYVREKGAHYGNSVIRKVSDLLRANLRGSDVLVRYGADAFAIMMPNTSLSAGRSLSNRFNAIIKNYPFIFGDTQPKGKITVSVGMTFLEGQSPEEFILSTEMAVRKAIEKGGDRVEVYEKETFQDASFS